MSTFVTPFIPLFLWDSIHRHPAKRWNRRGCLRIHGSCTERDTAVLLRLRRWRHVSLLQSRWCHGPWDQWKVYIWAIHVSFPYRVYKPSYLLKHLETDSAVQHWVQYSHTGTEDNHLERRQRTKTQKKWTPLNVISYFYSRTLAFFKCFLIFFSTQYSHIVALKSHLYNVTSTTHC